MIWCRVCGFLKMVKVADNVKGVLCGNVSDWKTVLTSNGEVLGEVGIKRGIFQGTPLLHCCLFSR